MMSTVFQAFLFFLPAGIANMSPVLANKIPLLNSWNTPIDFGRSYKGRRLLGDNKRWRGLVIGSLLASATAVLLWLTFPHTLPFTSISHATIAGLALGVGALLGDVVESFFKRQKNFTPGQSWFPFDQLDYIIGGLLFVYPFTRPSFKTMFIIVVLYFALHIGSAYIGYLLKLKDQPI